MILILFIPNEFNVTPSIGVQFPGNGAHTNADEDGEFISLVCDSVKINP